MRQARAGHDTCGQRVTPRCRWAAGPGRTTSRRAERSSRRGRIAGGSPPTGTHSDQAPQVWRAPEGPEGTGGLRDRPLRAAGSRVAISRAAGPNGARNTRGATSNTSRKAAAHGHRSQALRSLRRPSTSAATGMLVCVSVRCLEARPCPPVPPAPSTPVAPGRCVCRWVAARPRAVRAASFARRVVSKPGEAPPPTGTAARPCRRPRAPRPALACRIAEPTLNFPRNSLAALSNHELRSLELQRFQTLLNVHPIELRAAFCWGCRRH